MAYHVTIIPAEKRSAEPITSAELDRKPVTELGWLLVQQDGETVLRSESEPAVDLFLHEGTLWTSNPTEPALRKIVVLADALGARARGDEFETYRSDLSTYLHPEDRRQIEATRISAFAVIMNRYGYSALIVLGIAGAALILKSCGMLE